MSEARRQLMHAAVAAGGASAALMSAAVVGGHTEVLAASRECLDPVLRAALLLIDASSGMRGTPERERLKRAIEDYLDAAPSPEART